MQPQGHHSSHHHHHGGGQSRGPEVFYGYCHDTKRMRMMDYNDYVNNSQTAYSNFYKDPASAMQPYIDSMTSAMRGTAPAYHHGHGCGCGCHDRHHCNCDCCIQCADAVEYARCGEVRRIPITFENDTRRERPVKLQISGFSTESGQDVGWQASLSETEFTLAPCGHHTVLVTVNVDCSKIGTQTGTSPVGTAEGRQPTVDSCKVVYAKLSGDGCFIRPLVLAVAVLPTNCGDHRAGCQCSCCCG